MAEVCIKHDVYDELEKISAPTLVIGGEASREIAKKIKGYKKKE